MAGGTSGNTPASGAKKRFSYSRGPSRGIRRLAPFLASAISLNALQQQDVASSSSSSEDPRTLQDTSLSDDSLSLYSEARPPSPLELHSVRRSYTQQEADQDSSTGGGTIKSAALEILQMKELDEQLRRAQTQFISPTVNEETEHQTSSVASPPDEDFPEETEENTEEEDDEEAPSMDRRRALELNRDKSAASQEQQLKDQLSRQIKQQLEKQVTQAVRGTQSGVRFAMEGIEVGTSEAVIPLLVLILQLNLQMASKYLLRPFIQGTAGENVSNKLEGMPFFDQTIWEDFATVTIDTMMCCGATCCNPVLAPIVLIVTLMIAVVYQLLNNLPGAETLTKIIQVITGGG